MRMHVNGLTRLHSRRLAAHALRLAEPPPAPALAPALISQRQGGRGQLIHGFAVGIFHSSRSSDSCIGCECGKILTSCNL